MAKHSRSTPRVQGDKDATGDVDAQERVNNSSGSAERSRQLALEEERRCREAVISHTPINLEGARARLSALRDKLRETFVDRDEAIDALLAALISRAGCVMLGPPGTAKSMLIREIASECSLVKGGDQANYFEYLLTAHTMPEEIFGPTDISKLLGESPEVTRKTDGRLPHAEIAFLDEVFRGGSHILNTLLTILNERKFHNGREIEDVPLISFIGAANFPPQTEELQALYDRFPVRIWVDSVLTGRLGDQLTKNATRLLTASYPGSSTRAEPAGASKISTRDFRRLWADLYMRLGVPKAQDKRLSEFIKNFNLFQSHVQLSDRAFGQLWLFAGAIDVVRGSQPTQPTGGGGVGHIECFKYVSPTATHQAGIRDQVEELYASYGIQGL